MVSTHICHCKEHQVLKDKAAYPSEALLFRWLMSPQLFSLTSVFLVLGPNHVFFCCVDSDGGRGLDPHAQDGDLRSWGREEERQKCSEHAGDVHCVPDRNKVSTACCSPVWYERKFCGLSCEVFTLYMFYLYFLLWCCIYWLSKNRTKFYCGPFFKGQWMQSLKAITQPPTVCGGGTVSLNCCATTW